MKIGFTSVVGDLMHAGHALMLDECKRHCDYLYVGIITDPTKDRPWKNKPVQSLFERYVQLASHRAVDEVVPLESEADLDLALRSLPIEIRFVGEDYIGKDFTGKATCEELGIEIFYNKRAHGLSSTELRKRVENGKLYCDDSVVQKSRQTGNPAIFFGYRHPKRPNIHFRPNAGGCARICKIQRAGKYNISARKSRSAGEKQRFESL